MNRALKNHLIVEIDELAVRGDDSLPQAFLGAMQSFFAALETKGDSLPRASLAAATTEFAAAVESAVRNQLGWPAHARAVCKRIRELLRGSVSENWDEIGSELEARFDDRLRVLTSLRDGSVKLLHSHGIAVASAAQLDADLADIVGLKKEMLDDWPWSTNELPPVDWDMVEASKAELANGGTGEPIEDLIRRLGGAVEKSRWQRDGF